MIALVAMLASVAGCSLPRGPVNIDPLVPRWLSHRDLSTKCPAPEDKQAAMPPPPPGPTVLKPPIPKFHPVPTRPVFAPQPAGFAAPLEDGPRSPVEGPMQALPGEPGRLPPEPEGEPISALEAAGGPRRF